MCASKVSQMQFLLQKSRFDSIRNIDLLQVKDYSMDLGVEGLVLSPTAFHVVLKMANTMPLFFAGALFSGKIC